MTVYLAGKITGDDGYREKFRKAADKLRQCGYDVLNPAVLPSDGLKRDDYMRICLAMLESAKIAVFLDDWQESAGARAEMAYCGAVNKTVMLYSDAVEWREQAVSGSGLLDP